MEMSTTQTVPQREDTAIQGDLYMSFELGDKSWKVTASDGHRSPEPVQRGRRRHGRSCALHRQGPGALQARAAARVHSCYEAGRDGWWLHRWLIEQGVDNIVVDSSSIEVNRHARRAKTDRLDGDKLLAMLMRHHRGERVWSVVHDPNARAGRRRGALHRELDRLTQERTSHTNRIGSLLVLHNLRSDVIVGGRDWTHWWDAACASRCRQVCAPRSSARCARLTLVRQQIKALEAQTARGGAQRQAAAGGAACTAARHRTGGAWVLVKELFGWRQLRQPARTGRLPGAGAHALCQRRQPDRAGHQQGRQQASAWLLVELAWGWLRLQPDSALTQWFNRRFAGGGKRMRRVGIVALARQLAIALWRYLQHGEIPAGATLKPAAA